jgi:truncated hemoglobin YjbI
MSDEKTYHEEVGGEPAVRRLAAAFYDEMESNPNAEDILVMHEDMAVERSPVVLYP